MECAITLSFKGMAYKHFELGVEGLQKPPWCTCQGKWQVHLTALYYRACVWLARVHACVVCERSES